MAQGCTDLVQPVQPLNRDGELAGLAHRHGVKFGYVMTTGVELDARG